MNTNKKSLIPVGLTLALVGVLALPVAASAATYQYIDNTGCIASIEAPTAMSAMSLAASISLHSGVIEITHPSQAMSSSNCVPVSGMTANN